MTIPLDPVGAALSPAEREILAALVAGKCTKQIAVARSRSIKTVSCQVWAIKQKAGVRTEVQLGVWAARNGLAEAS